VGCARGPLPCRRYGAFEFLGHQKHLERLRPRIDSLIQRESSLKAENERLLKAHSGVESVVHEDDLSLYHLRNISMLILTLDWLGIAYVLRCRY
jgi:hypothetical protein